MPDVVVQNGQFALVHADRVIEFRLASLDNLQDLIEIGKHYGDGEVNLTAAVLRFALVYIITDDANSYMAAVHASWPIKMFSAESFEAIRALAKTEDMSSVVNYLNLTHQAT